MGMGAKPKWGDMRSVAALLAALLLASCTFSSERPLFAEEDAVTPIADGAVYDWKPSGEEDDDVVVRFVRVGARYEVRPVNDPSASMRVQFVSVIDTHDDDYIVQVNLETADGGGVAYAFLWPIGDDRYRVLIQPSAFDANGAAPSSEYCTPAAYGGCSFRSSDDVRSYYLEVLYPAFQSGHIPARYIDMSPVPQPSAPRK
ncbi:MAG: hypothetical protein H7Z14_02765 [Anaerolineae bacterium]|nr:hypothetical protein [Phycisphaerae bacterium]